MATVAGLVTSNLGVSLVPELTVPYFDPKQVAIVVLAAPALNRPVCVVTPAGKTLSKAAQEFVRLLGRSELPTTKTCAPGKAKK